MNAEGRRLVGLAWSGLRIFTGYIFFLFFSVILFSFFLFFFYSHWEGCGTLLVSDSWGSGGSAEFIVWREGVLVEEQQQEEVGEEEEEEELRGTKEGDFWVKIEKLTLSTTKQPADPLRRVPRVGNRAMFQLQARWLKVLFQSSTNEARPK